MATTRVGVRALASLNLPDCCEACFWIMQRCERKIPFQIPMPGIFRSIDAYVKRVIHTYFDEYGALPAWLPDLGNVQSYVKPLHWSWYKYADPTTGITLAGEPDDIFVLEDGGHHFVDYKVAKFTEGQERILPLYEAQLNSYAFIGERLLDHGPYSPVGALSLVYLEPVTEMDEKKLEKLGSAKMHTLQFKGTLKRVDIGPENMIPKLLEKVHNILELDETPEHATDCRDQELLDRLLEILNP